jgi:hypothetical protein
MSIGAVAAHFSLLSWAPGARTTPLLTKIRRPPFSSKD